MSLLAAARRDSDGFRLRGTEMTRIETFTDAAFAFALTLLVISNDPLSSFADLAGITALIPIFVLSASLLMMFWYGHHQWSRRYGLDDGMTIVLSCLLVFTLLIYVYPLRFVFGGFVFWMFDIIGDPPDVGFVLQPSEYAQINTMFVIYGVGFIAMSLAIVLLHVHAWRQRNALELDAVERYLTIANIRSWSILVAVGALSIVLALVLPPEMLGAPGWAYALLGFIMPYYGMRAGKEARRIAAVSQDG